jgi:hypothetical protein
MDRSNIKTKIMNSYTEAQTKPSTSAKKIDGNASFINLN